MKTNERENKARILPFRKKDQDVSEQNVSEVTRNLFSDAWKSYLDQSSMAAIKLDQSIQTKKEEEAETKKAKLTIV